MSRRSRRQRGKLLEAKREKKEKEIKAQLQQEMERRRQADLKPKPHKIGKRKTALLFAAAHSKHDRHQPDVGVSVTTRVRTIHLSSSPHPSWREMEKIQLHPVNPLDLHAEEDEGVPASLTGMAVDYLTRMALTGEDAAKTFNIACLGFENSRYMCEDQYFETFYQLLNEVDELHKSGSTDWIRLAAYPALALVTCDSLYRTGTGKPFHLKDGTVVPWISDRTCLPVTSHDIDEMVHRGIKLFENYEPLVAAEITFQGGYTGIIASGDGDYLTENTLWDFKVSIKEPNNRQLLQLLVYWQMGLKSIHPEYQKVKFLALFNPRTNTIYRLSTDQVSPECVRWLQNDVIGYGNGMPQF